MAEHLADDYVLLVDDDHCFSSMLSIALTSLGWTVRVASNAAAAQEIRAESSPIAVLCDLELGTGMNGLELLALVSEDEPELPVALISGHREHHIRGVDPGSRVPVLLKPFDLAELEQFLGELLGSSRAQESLHGVPNQQPNAI